MVAVALFWHWFEAGLRDMEFLLRPKPHGNTCQDTLQAHPCGLYAGHPWPSKVLSGITARLRPYFRIARESCGRVDPLSVKVAH